MPYDISEAFEKIEDELIGSMIRNLGRHKAEETELGYRWEQWQAIQLKALEDYHRNNREKFPERFNKLNQQIREVLQDSYNDGSTQQERKLLQAVKRGFKGEPGTNSPAFTGQTETTGEFFKVNDRKLDALITATTHDMEKAETAVLRKADDQYRRIIFNAQVYGNTGAGTYEKAVDMATKDFLRAGINCIEYKNGSRHTITDYADMAIKTAAKRAYLQGEGAKRQEQGIPTVILNKRSNACPLCTPFCGKVFIDDVWSGGDKSGISPVTGAKYPLLSDAIAQGLYHPRCQDSHTTYFEGINTAPDVSEYTKEELDAMAEKYNAEQKRAYCERQEKRYSRMSEYSLDPDNKRMYKARANEWGNKAESFKHLKEVIKLERDDKNLLYRKSKLRVSEDTISIKRNMKGQDTVKAKKISNSKHDLYVSTIANSNEETLRFYDKKLTEIEKSIKFKTSGMKKPKYVIVNGDNQISPNAIASYDPVTNIMYLRDNTNSNEKMIDFQMLGGANSVTCSDNPNSSITHEFMHWYRFKYAKKLAKITGGNQKEILQKSQEEVLAFLMKSNYNIRKELGNYAYSSYLQSIHQEEVIVELLTKYHCAYESDNQTMQQVIRKWFNDRV